MRFQSVRLSLRFIVPLALVLSLVAFVVVPFVDNLTALVRPGSRHAFAIAGQCVAGTAAGICAAKAEKK